MSPTSESAALGALALSAKPRHAPPASRLARHGLIALAVLAVAALTGAARAVELSIDEFTLPGSAATYQSNNTSGHTQFQWTNADLTTGTLGSIRDGSIGCETYQVNSRTTATVGAGSLMVASTGNSTPSIYLTYDGTSGWPQVGSPPAADPETNPFNGLLGSAVDLSAYSHIVFCFTSVAGWDTGFNDFRITIVEGAAGTPTTVDSTWYSSDQATSINQIVNTNSTNPQYYYFPLATLTNSSSQPPSLTAVQAINIHACTNDTGLDYTLDYIRATTVPEPSTALLTLGVTLGLALRRRPRRRAA